MIKGKLAFSIFGVLASLKFLSTYSEVKSLNLAVHTAKASGSEVDSSPPFFSWAAWKPDYWLVQHSSYVGFAAGGVGYGQHDSRLAFEWIYGFTPEQFAGHNVHSGSAKTLWRISNFDLPQNLQLRPLLGLNIIYSPDPDLFIILPEQYSPWYYPPTAIRPALVFGAEVARKDGWGASLEYSVLDTEFPFFHNKKSFNFDQVGSLGFVLRKSFR